MTAPLSATGLLQLIWLASPALPIGGFSYSEGLEASVDSGLVATESGVSDWLSDQLALSLGRSDLPCLAQAIPAWRDNDLARIQALTTWLLATRESAEFRAQTEQMGRSLVEWLRLQHADVDTAFASIAPTYPIAFAFAASRVPASVQDGCLAFAFGWAENMVSAAVKAVPLGQSAGQRILARLAAEIPAVVEAALQMSDGDRIAFTPMLAILSAQHETQYSRLFRS
ncbi:MAG: urease accessory UreF family protein [Pseudomonadota bacterium]